MRANLGDGRTVHYDLRAVDGVRGWQNVESDPRTNRSIRAVLIDAGNTAIAVTAPRRFRTYSYTAEPCRNGTGEIVAEKICVQADDVRLSVLAYNDGRMARVDLTRTGRPRHLAQFRRRSDGRT